MDSLLNRYFLSLLACLIICGTYLIVTMPQPNEYYVGADEGVYYRQAKIIGKKGISGFHEIGDSYIQNENEHVFPHPLRTGHLILASLFVMFNDSISSLSFLSLFAWITLCIVTFFFIKKHWDEQTALLASLFICFSPLAMGMARRALMDSEVYLFFSLPLFAFINYITVPSRKKFIVFLALLGLSILVKETAILLLPFYAITLLVLQYIEKRPLRVLDGLMILALPVIVAGVVNLIVFGGFSRVWKITEIVLNTSVFLEKPFDYVTNYMSGPWYQYFSDYFILSPLISILFFLFAGYHITAERKNLAASVLLAFFAWHILSLSFLSKDIRYAINLDLVYRIAAAIMFIFLTGKITSPETRKIVVAGSLIFFVYFEIVKFNRIFLTGKVYDPVAYNLLVSEKFIPGPAPQQTQTAPPPPAEKLEKLTEQALGAPSPEKFLELSVAFYQAGRYEECIAAANKAIALKPDFADAYNNMGSAYTMLKQYDQGIEACEKALQIRPDFQLAKNNLKWAKDEKAALNK